MTNLPHRDEDPILTLYAHYFIAADLMRDNYRKIEKEGRKRRIGQNKAVFQGIYFCTWLGFLAVVCEGFHKIRVHALIREHRSDEFLELLPKSGEIGSLIKRHVNALRDVRNNVFHLRSDTKAIENFFSRTESRLEWADDLHQAFSDFFSRYRILCEVDYIFNERTEESQIFKHNRQKTTLRNNN